MNGPTECEAYASDYPSTHTCDDPLGCALARLIAGPDPRDVELEVLHEVLDRVEELCEGRKTVRTEAILAEVHRARRGAAEVALVGGEQR